MKNSFAKATLALFAAFTMAIAGCGWSISVAPSDDPTKPFYKKPGVDFASYDRALIEFTRVEATGEVEIEAFTKRVYLSLHDSLEKSGLFDEVRLRDAGVGVPENSLLVIAEVSFNGGSRKLRIISGVTINALLLTLELAAIVATGIAPAEPIFIESGLGIGRAVMEFNYYVKDSATNELLGKMTARDTMSAMTEGEHLIDKAALKWNRFFVVRILGGTDPI